MKNKIVLSLSLVVFTSISVQAGTKLSDAQKRLIALQQPNSPGGFFDNDREANTSDTKEEKIISEKTQEDFGSGAGGIRFSEIQYKHFAPGSSSNLFASTSTFDGDYLRSTTYCEGTLSGGGGLSGSRTVYCATASQKACENVLAAYYYQMGKPANAEESKKALACVDTMKKYSEVLYGYTQLMGNNTKMANVRGELVEREGVAMKKVLGKINSDAMFTTTSLNELKSKAEIEAVTNQLSGSVGGFMQIAKFIDLCERNKKSWNPSQANPNRPGSSGAKGTGVAR